VLNAFLLDHIDTDLLLLNRINDVLADGEKAFGAGFRESMSTQAIQRGALPYRSVRALAIRPSEDIGKLASAFVRRGKFKGGNPILTRRLLDLLDIGVGTEADLASYLLFDGNFAGQLIELGRADARARKDDILEFFADVDAHEKPAVGGAIDP
jgi:NTE family protein